MDQKIKPTILFVLTHPYANTVSDDEVLQAIPSHLKNIHYQIVPIDINKGDLSKLGEVDFTDLKNRQSQFFKSAVEPLLKSKPNRHVLYVGKAPIPLAVHLGSLVETFEATDAAFQRHRSNEWYFDPQADSATDIVAEISPGGSQAPGDIVIKIETSFSISDSDVDRTISKPLAKFSLRTNKIEPDCMNGVLAKTIVKALLDILANVNSSYPNRTGIHLFMAVPMGLAFEIGAALNPTIYFPIVTYQYFKGHVQPYRKAIVLGEETTPGATLSEAQKKATSETINIWSDQLSKLKQVALEVKKRNSDKKVENTRGAWIEQLFPGSQFGQRLSSNFANQTGIADSAIEDFKMAQQFDSSGLEFSYDPVEKVWSIGDYIGYQFWLSANNEKEKLELSIRLFLLHEAAHVERQRLRRENSSNVGRFARVLEEIDYQADIWALLHELFYTINILNSNEPPRKIAMDIIITMVNSFMAFDRASGFRDGFQVRRLNRYLLWLWQYVLLSEARADVTLDDVIEVLLDKPVIDLAGPQIVCRSERIFMSLQGGAIISPEVGLYYEGVFSRHEGSDAINIFQGLEKFDIQKMIDSLRSIYNKVHH